MTFEICIQNLSKYNEGELIYRWISLPATEEELEEVLQEVLGEDEEYMIADYMNDIGYEVGEYENIERLNVLAEALDLIEYNGLTMVLEAALQEGYSLEEAIETVKEGYYTIYEATNAKELGHYLVNEVYYDDDNIPDWLWGYIDYEGIGGDFAVDNPGVFIGSYYIVID